MWDDHISELLPAHQIVSSLYFCHLPCLYLDYQLFEYIEFIFLLARCAWSPNRTSLSHTKHSSKMSWRQRRMKLDTWKQQNGVWSKSVMLSTLHFAYHRLPSKIQVSGTQRKLHTFFFLMKQGRQYFFGLKDIENIL